MSNVMELAKALGRAMQQDEAYLAFRAATEANDNDTELQDLIARYQSKQLDAANAEDAGSDPEQASALRREAAVLYNQLMSQPTMMQYLGARGRFEQMLDSVNRVIAASAAGQDPDNFNPADFGGCGGNCAGCNGCG